MRQLYPVSLKVADYDGIENVDELVDDFKADAQDAYDAREVKLGEEMMRELERQVWLTVLDRKWREHLYEMDYLREGIGLRAMAQRDPLVEYKREGADMFDAMRAAFQEEVVGFLFNLDIQVPDAPEVGVQRDENGEEVDVRQMLSAGGDSPSGSGAATATATRTAKRAAEPAQAPAVKRAAIKGLERNEPQHMTYSAPTETGDVEELRGDEKTDEDDLFAGIGRNDPCPCGSGKKFKNCHGRNPNIR